MLYFVEYGLEYLIAHRVERHIEAVVYLVLKFLELSMTGAVGNLHIAVAKTIARLIPCAEFCCGIDRVCLFGDIERERFAGRTTGTGWDTFFDWEVLGGETLNTFLPHDGLGNDGQLLECGSLWIEVMVTEPIAIERHLVRGVNNQLP